MSIIRAAEQHHQSGGAASSERRSSIIRAADEHHRSGGAASRRRSSSRGIGGTSSGAAKKKWTLRADYICKSDMDPYYEGRVRSCGFLDEVFSVRHIMSTAFNETRLKL